MQKYFIIEASDFAIPDIAWGFLIKFVLILRMSPVMWTKLVVYKKLVADRGLFFPCTCPRSLISFPFLGKKLHDSFPHTSYLPHLAPGDFFCFVRMKWDMRIHSFNDVKETKRKERRNLQPDYRRFRITFLTMESSIRQVYKLVWTIYWRC